MSEILYNGIELPEAWPPVLDISDNNDEIEIPYLVKKPEVIPIDTGRQLFVDDFLINHTDLEVEYHKAKKFEGNPVLYPSTNLERGADDFALPCACPKSGGVWWDKKDGLFKMWYEAGWLQALAYAQSNDGIHWDRPVLEFEKGTNRIMPSIRPDSTTFLIDETDEKFRYKMFLHGPGGGYAGMVAQSEDGIHWRDFNYTNCMGDRSTVFL